MALTFQEVDQILRIVEEFPATEVRFEYGDLKLHIHLADAGGAPTPAALPHASASSAAPAPAAARTVTVPAAPAARPPAQSVSREGLVNVSSPMMGVFYAAPAPDAPPFVTAGQEVAEGADLCIIEVMKIMNTIKAPCAGTVVEAVAANGETVQSGAPLFWIRPQGGKGAR